METKRLAWDEYFAAQALLIANRSTCKRARFWSKTTRLFLRDIMAPYQEQNIVLITNVW